MKFNSEMSKLDWGTVISLGNAYRDTNAVLEKHQATY